PLESRSINDAAMTRRVTLDPTQASRRWYGLERWRRRARAQLSKQPWCVMCLSRGVTTVATVADHIVPHSYSWDAFWTGELQSLCAHCHNTTKREIERHGYSREIGVDGMPVDPAHPIYRDGIAPLKSEANSTPNGRSGRKQPQKQENKLLPGSVPPWVW